ncbi:MAG: 2-hydroxyacyl-CoA dehydratase [Deltaproteobacteria bacterium]|nr:2-hydroxyacyl-CoA dehydratase [Deltaproteobacteria bacterium]
MTPKIPFADLLDEVVQIASQDWTGIASHFPPGRTPIGFFCPYVPEELLQAAGAFPLRLMGGPVEISQAQGHLPNFCCHLVKSSLESYLQGELDFLEGIVFSQSCDTMKGLADIWAIESRLSFQFNLMVPSRLNSPLARDYFKTEVEALKKALEKKLGNISLESLQEAIRLFNGIRDRLRALYSLRRLNPGRLSGKGLARIIRAGYLMDRTQYLRLLTGLVDSRPEQSETKDAGVPLFLSGNIVHSGDWFSLIEEAGGTIAGDDLCSGARTFRLTVKEEGDPLEALVDRYFTIFFCPTKHQGIQAHQELLLREVRESGAKGVIFIFYKYCEPYYFDYPDLKKALEAEGLPTLLLEIEDPSLSRGQIKTRVQAFVEMLS